MISQQEYNQALQSAFVQRVARLALDLLASQGLGREDAAAYSWAIVGATQGERLTYAQHSAVVQLLGNSWMLERVEPS
jgi:hypothetical protein